MCDHRARFEDDRVKEEESEAVLVTDERKEEKSVGVNGNLSKNKLKIKIKVGKAGNEREDQKEEEKMEEETSRKRFCQLCNKFFSSGKALGGHMRIHPSNGESEVSNYGKRTQSSKLEFHGAVMEEENVKNQEEDESFKPQKSNGDTTCSLCGKIFPSMKSLFGHMRCHPERDWRGINPPAKKKESSIVRVWRGNNPPPANKRSPASTVSDSGGQKTDDQLDSASMPRKILPDRVRLLSSWSVTARRGRKASKSFIPPKNLDCKKEPDDPLPDAVYNLMLLARGDCLDFVLPKKHRIEESESENREIITKKQKIYIDDRDSRYELDSRSDDSRQNSDESENYDRAENHPSDRTEIRKRKKKRKIRALETVHGMDLSDYKQQSVATGKHKCITCKRTFPSHQALGGHRASHRKGKDSTLTDEFTYDLEDETNAAKDLHQVENSPELDDKKAVMQHLCTICNKGFPSGQALGGHKRCHWTGPGPVEAPASSITSPEGIRKTGRRSLEFDLNQPPVIDDEDIEFLASAQSVGHESCFHSSVTFSGTYSLA